MEKYKYLSNFDFVFGDLMPFLACWIMNVGTQAFPRVGWQSST
jgi:hypothetical protein